MSEKAIVYWTSPYELSAIANSSKSMITNNLVKTRFILDKILDNINSGDKVGVKVHVGEAYNTHYLRPDYVREVVEVIKLKGGIPTLIETQGIGMEPHLVDVPNACTFRLGSRKTASEHRKIADLHGYTESIIGAPLEFIDGDIGIDGKNVEINGIHLKNVAVGSGIFKFDKLIVVSHFKGHPQAGFGGAFKQLGIGCVTKRNKSLAHFIGKPETTKKCEISSYKKECVQICPVNAIKIDNDHVVINPDICIGCLGCNEVCPVRKAIKPGSFYDFRTFCENFIDNASAVIKSFGSEKIRYITFAFDIPLMCDCVVNANMPIIPDLGIFGSSDPLAIDKACIDMETKAPGLPVMDAKGEWKTPLSSGVEKFKGTNASVDPMWVLDAAVKNKLGNPNYELIKI